MRLRGLTRGWPLRRRLAYGIAALVAGVCIAIAILTTFASRQFLVDRLDADLDKSAQRAGSIAGVIPDDVPPPTADSKPGRGETVGTINVRISGDEADGFILADQNDPRPKALSSAATEDLADIARDGEPHSVDVEGYGSYRAVAVTVDGSDGTDTVVVALPMDSIGETVTQLLIFEGVLTVAAIGGAVFVGGRMVRRSLRPLERVTATATSISKLPLEQGDVMLAARAHVDDRRTEAGQVAIAVNQMLDHLAVALQARHESEMRVRRFVADASHELRTPLTSIRGYAELSRRRYPDVPDDLRYAITRVEAESTRMSDLVEDLLLLARLDSGRPLAAEPVDLTRLVIDGVNDARVSAHDHSWTVALSSEPIYVTGDEARLRQVLANLLRNAAIHTPPGTTVRTRLTLEGRDAVLTVTDNGPGIPDEFAAQLFERFTRADTSRSHSHGSTGLGLAIVAAVVHAHAGDVDQHSRPGMTTFTVRIPAHTFSGAGSLRPTGSCRPAAR
ncbi:HAMP domain-containing histidine kinase [Nocardioidaceae bacterium SCSIO 66511]|nr:HAMP domain-containing histidine kinase [Nocardioidaceae bacterium SCSIO 66511]